LQWKVPLLFFLSVEDGVTSVKVKNTHQRQTPTGISMGVRLYLIFIIYLLFFCNCMMHIEIEPIIIQNIRITTKGLVLLVSSLVV
jgi:hypothetical protein